MNRNPVRYQIIERRGERRNTPIAKQDVANVFSVVARSLTRSLWIVTSASPVTARYSAVSSIPPPGPCRSTRWPVMQAP